MKLSFVVEISKKIQGKLDALNQGHEQGKTLASLCTDTKCHQSFCHQVSFLLNLGELKKK